MAGNKTRPLLDRFQEKYVCNLETGCWEWTASLQASGYGQIAAPGGGMLRSHRVSYELFVGPILNGLHVLHECDNPKCVNPEHLFLGTPKDNMKDKVAKGRHRFGESDPKSVLKEKEVLAVKEMFRRFPCTRKRTELAWGVGTFLAEWFGVRKSAIWDIKKGRNWSHLC